MNEFRKLMLVALMSGTLAGLVWFAAQYVAVIPLIERAEVYESAAHHDADEGWHPRDGWQRSSFTAAATVLTGIALAAILFGIASLADQRVDAKKGLLWGLAGFACFSLAPALGLPPQPPGAAVADLFSRQLWWTSTIVATAVGIYLIARSRSWQLKIGGIACIALPHVIGAPAPAGESVVPIQLMRQFIFASLGASALFWMTLGIVGGLIYRGLIYHRSAGGKTLDTPEKDASAQKIDRRSCAETRAHPITL